MQGQRDPIYDNAKQEAEEYIRSQIINMIQSGDNDAFVNETIRDISLTDIHDILFRLYVDNSLPFKLTRVAHIKIENLETFEQLCDHMEIYDVSIPEKEAQRVYFLETSDCAITVIPIQLSPEDGINIQIELLEDSPAFVKELWNKATRKKGLDDIKFVKFGKGD